MGADFSAFRDKIVQTDIISHMNMTPLVCHWDGRYWGAGGCLCFLVVSSTMTMNFWSVKLFYSASKVQRYTLGTVWSEIRIPFVTSEQKH